ncbi:hypothetical protein N9K60_00650 [Candidatus Poseidoniales archaeon]|nr:hypothetical protein [Candidatus Poseidoniales archaeon]
MRGRSKAYSGRAIATLLILLMGFSTLPLTNVSAEDTGDLYHLQAQDITANFDSATELTTITWRNIDSLDQPGALDNFFSAVYNLYRHTEIIDSQNVANATLIAELDACDSETYSVKYLCLGGANGSHPGHTFSYLVEPGTNDSFYYGVTTLITGQDNSVSRYDGLIINEAATYDPIIESTTPIRTPYNLQATYDPTSSITTLSWINYNDIFQILPETGPNAYQTRIWQTDSELSRNTSQTVLQDESPIAYLGPGISSYELSIPVDTDREVYYGITYLLPDYLGENQDYEDIRFLSNNALSTPLAEDNMPPDAVTSVSSYFTAQPETGGGLTTISWSDVVGEAGESYAIFTSGTEFNKTTDFGANQIGLVTEGISQFVYQLPIGRLGNSHYCVVVIDHNGIFDVDIPEYSCAEVYEDAFYNWIAEPKNVVATFMGNSQTLITWNDQLGAEGEIYHIWRSNYLVSGSQFVENVTMEYQGTVTDGIQQFVATVPPEEDRTSFYFVTSEALYQHENGTYHYTQLIQNWFGPIYEETLTPAAPRINSIDVEGEISQVEIEWLNDQQLDGESYSIWQHTGDPFGELENQVSIVNASNGWFLFDDDIVDTGSAQNEFTFNKNYQISDDVERNIWYAVVVEDIYGNQNLEAFPGSGGNALNVKEDTVPPTASYQLFADGELYLSPSLVSGSFTIRLSVNEYLFSSPTVDITTSSGGMITTSPRQMLMFADNLLNDELGPEYYYTFDIANSVSAGAISITVDMVDESYNNQIITWEDRSLDAQNPSMTVYSPASSSDGSKYLYGNKITINAGATDDVEVSLIQYKFIYNYGSGNAVTTPWTIPTDIQDVLGENKSLVFSEEVSAGNFEPGTHAVQIRAIDSAGNEVLKQVIFIVDYCRNRIDGTTVCNYEESLKPAPDPIVVEPSFTDPPYVFVWVTSGVAVLAIILMLFVISAGMRGPKKKKSDDEYDDDDWMSEFIGTSQDVDMDSITNTAKSVPVEEEEKPAADVQEAADKEEDPFAVNVLSRKSRRTKAKPTPEPEEDEDDPFFGLDDEDFDEEEVEEKPKPKRKVGRRVTPKNAPKRRPTRRKKSDD